MNNYMQYHVMGSVSKVSMKPGCIPTKFACQSDEEPQTSSTMMMLNVCEPSLQDENIIQESSMQVEHSDCNELATENSGIYFFKIYISFMFHHYQGSYYLSSLKGL